jgi:hypothetical protein
MYYYINLMTWLTVFVFILPVCELASILSVVCNANIDEQIQYASNEWTYPSDVAEIRLDSPFSHKDSSKLCDRCRNIDLNAPLSSLHKPKDGCDLCQLLIKPLEEARNKEPKTPLLEARQYVRICAVPSV